MKRSGDRVTLGRFWSLGDTVKAEVVYHRGGFLKPMHR